MSGNLPFTPELVDALYAEFKVRLDKDKKKEAVPLTVSEFADRINVSIGTVYRRIDAGDINKVPNLGGITRIPASELERFI